MTISRDDFDKGRIDFRAHLAAILESMPHTAFTTPALEEELGARLGGLSPNQEDFASSLRSLEADGTIVSKEVSGLTFWAIADRGTSAG